MAEKSEKRSKIKYYFVLGIIVFSFLGWGGCKGCQYVGQDEYTGIVQRAEPTKVDDEYRVEFLIDEDIRVFKNVDSNLYWKTDSADIQAQLGRYADQRVEQVPGFKIDWYMELLGNSGPMRYAEDASLENFRPDGWGNSHPVNGWGGPYHSKKTCHLCGSPNGFIVGGRTCDACLRRLKDRVRAQKELVDF